MPLRPSIPALCLLLSTVAGLCPASPAAAETCEVIGGRLNERLQASWAGWANPQPGQTSATTCRHLGDILGTVAELERFGNNPACIPLDKKGQQAEIQRLRSLIIGERGKLKCPAITARADIDLNAQFPRFAALYRSGNYGEALKFAEAVLAAGELQAGPDSPEIGPWLNNVAEAHRAAGNFLRAEPYFKRVIAILEGALGLEDVELAAPLNNLGACYVAMRRYVEANRLIARAMSLREKAFGPGDASLIRGLDNLAWLYHETEDFAKSERAARRALEILEQKAPQDEALKADLLSRLARAIGAQKRPGEAIPLTEQALAIRRRTLGREHGLVAAEVNNLALLHEAAGSLDEAEKRYKESLAMRRRTDGPDHPDVAITLNNLSSVLLKRGRWTDAADALRESTDILWRRRVRERSNFTRLDMNAELQASDNDILAFQRYVKALWRVATPGNATAATATDPAAAATAFLAAQRGAEGKAGLALGQMAARLASGNTATAELMRRRETLVRQWSEFNQFMAVARLLPPAKRDGEAERTIMQRMTSIDGQIGQVDVQLTQRGSPLRALAPNQSITVGDVQDLLRDGEVLVYLFETTSVPGLGEETFVWVITKNRMQWVRAKPGYVALSEWVAKIRCGIEANLWTKPVGSDKRGVDCNKALGAGRAPQRDAHGNPLSPPGFDVGSAHQLYQALFGGQTVIKPGDRLIIVAAGPLTRLPFQTLVTEAPGDDQLAAPDYRKTAWLGKAHAVTILPAVASLRALRDTARPSTAANAYVGFGNPLLEGDRNLSDDRRLAAAAREKQQCAARPAEQRVAELTVVRRGLRGTNAGSSLYADIAGLRAQVPLPETADELCAVAAGMAVDTARHLHLGAAATEARVKELSANGTLAGYRIVHFATHAAFAGQLRTGSDDVLDEPGLVLTPPATASATDDGYLSSSEIAALKLDADWVILSACNTGGGDTREENGLAGLAPAFFSAGARALLVSQWEVYSAETVLLITHALETLRTEPGAGRAEALRRSMVNMIDRGKPELAHPAFWGPFIVVGEGGQGR